MMDIDRFTFIVHTLKNIYKPINLRSKKQENEITLFSSDFICGVGVIKDKGLFAVRFWEEGSETCWQINVRFFEIIKGVKTIIDSLPEGRIICSDGRILKLNEGERFGCTYPFIRGGGTGWSKVEYSSSPFQLFMVEYKDKVNWAIRSCEIPPRVMRFTVLREGDSLRTSVYTEELAINRRKVYISPTIYFEPGASWKKIASRMIESLKEKLHIIPFESRTDVPEWAKKISLLVHLDGVG